MISRNSIKIGRLFGIDIGINFNWFIIFFIMVISFSRFVQAEYQMAGVTSMTFAVTTTLLLFASVLAHEYGHALTARAFGIKTRKIILHLFGGVAFLDSEPKRPSHEFFIAVAGPAVSIILAAAFGIAFLFLGSQIGQMGQLILFHLAALNLFLGVFNCVPGFPLDGGRVVRAVVWAVTGNYLKATKLAALGGVMVGALIMLWGFHGITLGLAGGYDSVAGGVMRILLGMFVIYLARVSSRQTEVVAAFHGLTVRDIMRPVRAVVPADALLSEVEEWFFRPLHADQLPVVEGDKLLGSISAEDLQRVPVRQWDWVRAHELVRPYETSGLLDPQAEALTALEQLAGGTRKSLPVFQERRLLGFITRNDLVQILRRQKLIVDGRT